MKGLTALLLVALLVVTGMNLWQIQQLRTEVSDLKKQVAEQRRANNLLAEAIAAVQQARDAIGKVDSREASGALQNAGKRLSEAAQAVNEKAAPAVKWLEEQVHGLNERLNGKEKPGR
jgi:TolA-binding protein